MSSTLSIYTLCVLVLCLKMLAISCYQGFHRLRHLAFSNPEDAGFFHRAANAEELPAVRRAARAWRNDLENIPLFFVLGGLCVALHTPWLPTVTGFCLFTLARLLHTVMYLSARQPWRTLAYAAGLASLVHLAALIAWQLNEMPA